MKVKILFLLSNFHSGGAETQYSNIIKNIDRNKFKPVLGLISYKDTPGEPFLKEFGEVETVEFKRKGAINISVIFNVAKYVRSNNIDLVQSLLFMDNQIGRLAGLIARVPVITSVRGEIGPILGPYKFWFEKNIQFLSTKIIVNSEWLKSYLVDNGSKKNKIINIYNGIDFTKYIANSSVEEIKRKHGILQERMVISIVARLHPMKDHMTFLKSIQCIRESIPDVCALIIGAGGEREKLESYVSDNDLKDNVMFLGSVGSDISEVYAMTDVLLVTSKYGESFPNVIVESMCSGTPVVSTGISAIPEIINHEFNGFIIDKGNYELFARRTLEILQNKELKSKFIINGRETAAKFSVKKMSMKYESLYIDIMYEK